MLLCPYNITVLMYQQMLLFKNCTSIGYKKYVFRIVFETYTKKETSYHKKQLCGLKAVIIIILYKADSDFVGEMAITELDEKLDFVGVGGCKGCANVSYSQ